MTHYFSALVAVVVPALVASAWLGIAGHLELHFKVALVTAIATLGVHSMMILFMIVTGRILREAIPSRDLSPTFLHELNTFFIEKKAYPAAILAALSIVVAGVLAQAQHALGLPTATHMLAGILALIYNLWVFPLELRTLRANQALVDRAAAELDSIDRQLIARGELPDDPQTTPADTARSAWIVALSIWLPYLYWALVVWRGDFAKVSVHPWAELSAGALVVWLVARRRGRPKARSAGETPGEQLSRRPPGPPSAAGRPGTPAR